MKTWTAIASLVMLTLFISFAQADDHTKTLFNDKCPISGKDVDASKTSDFVVEFCCKNCKGKFDKNPGKHLAKAAKAEAGTCIFNGKPAKASTTLTVGFCCGNCKGKFDDAPRSVIADVKPAAKPAE